MLSNSVDWRVGDKGAGLIRLASLGLLVPPTLIASDDVPENAPFLDEWLMVRASVRVHDSGDAMEPSRSSGMWPTYEVRHEDWTAKFLGLLTPECAWVIQPRARSRKGTVVHADFGVGQLRGVYGDIRGVCSGEPGDFEFDAVLDGESLVTNVERPSRAARLFLFALIDELSSARSRGIEGKWEFEVIHNRGAERPIFVQMQTLGD